VLRASTPHSLIRFLFVDGLLLTGWKACATGVRAAFVDSFSPEICVTPPWQAAVDNAALLWDTDIRGGTSFAILAQRR